MVYCILGTVLATPDPVSSLTWNHLFDDKGVDFLAFLQEFEKLGGKIFQWEPFKRILYQKKLIKNVLLSCPLYISLKYESSLNQMKDRNPRLVIGNLTFSRCRVLVEPGLHDPDHSE
jgi:hypothetical protein